MKSKNGGFKSGLAIGAIALSLIITGCGSSGGGDSTSLTGVFLDSPVSGLGYYTNTHHGMTGTGGAFQYQNGERVHFYLGDMELCDVEAMPVITPIDCVAGATDVTHPMVTNMLILLQSIDYDNDPENGIDITPVMHQVAQNLQLNLDCDPNEFRENYNFNNYLQLVNMQNGFQDHEDRIPPYMEQARLHMQETIMANGLYGYRNEMQNGFTNTSNPDYSSGQ